MFSTTALRFLFLGSLLLVACSTGVKAPIQPSQPPVNLPKIDKVNKIKSEEAVVVLPFQSIDDEFQMSMKPLWNNFYKEDFTDTRSVDVIVVTDRKLKGKNFGCSNNNFGVEMDLATRYGVCKINVPKNHSTGQYNLTRDNRQSSHNFFKILNSKILQSSELMEYLKKTKKIPLVFVHGFNVKYEDAILRAAQIAFDIKYQGPVILFSWPAGAGDGFFDDKMITKTYESNLKNAKASIESFKKFLTELSINDIKINLLAHSMGHQVVLPALKEISVSNNHKSVINELILNAPDFEANEFLKYIDNIKEISRRITLYCSYNDKALMASETYNKSERLGACTFSENIDSINVGLIDAPSIGELGHSYYASRAILGDVFLVLMGIDAEKRLFIKKSEPNSTEKYYLRP